MEILIATIIVFGGLFAGIFNAIVGGGSLVSVPLLIFSGLPIHTAIGTNRFAMIFNSSVAAFEYYKGAKYNVRMLLFPTLFAVIGSTLGATFVLQFNEIMLRYIVAVLMLVMGVVIFYKKELGFEKKEIDFPKKNYALIVVLSFVLGIYGGFFGAGVSTIFSFVFVSLLGFSFIRSAGMTRFIVAILSIIAVLIFFFNMKINFIYGSLLAVSFIIGAKIGVKLALKVGNLWIRRFMIILIVISSIRLIFF